MQEHVARQLVLGVLDVQLAEWVKADAVPEIEFAYDGDVFRPLAQVGSGSWNVFLRPWMLMSVGAPPIPASLSLQEKSGPPWLKEPDCSKQPQRRQNNRAGLVAHFDHECRDPLKACRNACPPTRHIGC